MSADDQFILNFHGIGVPHDGVESSERPFWIDEAFFERIIDMVAARADADRIQWTFDDGNKSDLIGASALANRGETAQFFLLTGRFGDPHYLSHDDGRALLAMGMRVGLHGRDHIDWRHLPHERLVAETIDARRDLADAVGAPIDSVAIPFGAYNRQVIGHLRRCGYRRIYTSDGGLVRAGAQVCSRTSVRNDMTLERISALIDDRVALRAKLRRTASIAARRHLV
jgi:peptidoglycan/xylan/chitin deacetylase (PgdA/CDA1 family)